MVAAYYEEKMKKIWEKINGWYADILQRESTVKLLQASINEMYENHPNLEEIVMEERDCGKRIIQLQQQIEQLHENIEKYHEIKYYYGLWKEKCEE